MFLVPLIPPVAMIGRGSVGSKMAMQLARSGAKISAVSDDGQLRPHHLARHALARAEHAGSKASEPAKEFELREQKNRSNRAMRSWIWRREKHANRSCQWKPHTRSTQLRLSVFARLCRPSRQRISNPALPSQRYSDAGTAAFSLKVPPSRWQRLRKGWIQFDVTRITVTAGSESHRYAPDGRYGSPDSW
ncbi:ThiF family protein [Bradyrhizobium macuxiense]|uniref:ThiF family protein n=1 Tax=Bradyrhizobium macuxiense TaxID=1755647 RepID=A0A560KUX9_9BRAD|nr:ThiF family protein [Bradyrhizobium macuxiense]